MYKCIHKLLTTFSSISTTAISASFLPPAIDYLTAQHWEYAELTHIKFVGNVAHYLKRKVFNHNNTTILCSSLQHYSE